MNEVNRTEIDSLIKGLSPDEIQSLGMDLGLKILEEQGVEAWINQDLDVRLMHRAMQADYQIRSSINE